MAREKESKLTDIEIHVRHETDKAYLVYDGKKTVWLPKSQVQLSDDKKTITMPEWLAIDKELV